MPIWSYNKLIFCQWSLVNVSPFLQCLFCVHGCRTNSLKQNRESTDGCSRWKVEKRYGKFVKIWSQQLEHKQVPKRGMEPGVRKGKRSLLASHTRCKCSMETFGKGQARYQVHDIGGKSDRLGSHCNWSRVSMSFNIRERATSYCWIRSPYWPLNFLNDDSKRSTRYPCLSSLLESRLAPRIKHSYEEHARAYRI